MGRPIKSQFMPKNAGKYMGPNINQIVSRSSWEHHLMMVLDNHPDVLGWSSESIRVPYKNPFTQRWTIYIPDFLVVYRTRTNATVTELIEVKPQEQMPGYTGKVSKLTEAAQMLNSVKWAAARYICQKNGWRFRVMAEDQMFALRRYNKKG